MGLDAEGIKHVASKTVAGVVTNLIDEVMSRNGDVADLFVALSRVNATMLLLMAKPDKTDDAVVNLMDLTKSALVMLDPHSADAAIMRKVFGFSSTEPVT